MKFKAMKTNLANNLVRAMRDHETRLFEVDVDKDVLWNLYLDSFPEGSNPIYRKRRVYDCTCCRRFIQTIGATVFIDEALNVHTIFEFDTGSDVFQPVMDALDAYIKSRPITDVFLYDSKTCGVDISRELMPDGNVNKYEHFFVEVPVQCREKSDRIGTAKSEVRDRKFVFKRSLDEISMEAIDIVLELIASNTLYKGEEWHNILTRFKQEKIAYEAVPVEKRDLYAWRKSTCILDVLGKIRNHSIGVLLTDISVGTDLDEAVKRYEKIVAPANYKRPKAIFTKRMLEDAKKTISELGYMDSLARRYATLDDITVNNILFSNRDSAKRIEGDVFDDMMSEIPTNPSKRLSRCEEVGIDDFIHNILPTAKEIEVLLENKHEPNMVSLIAPVNKNAPSMFKWNNAFSWAYSGNITDSDIRERVKSAGGNVDGALRFSIQWNDTNEISNDDLDAHCVEPGPNEIFFANMRNTFTGGFLDVDNRFPNGSVAIENIAWPSKSRMRAGRYLFAVHQYANRGGRGGFRAEIEFDGQIYRYNYPNVIKQGEMIKVAEVTLHVDRSFSIKNLLPSEASSRDIWGLKTNTFIPASVVMYSPNYWDDQNRIGHRHYFFMLKGCVNPECPNGFYNEFLKNDLEKHRRVFEALGSKMAVTSADDQLSGLGFSATKRNDLIVKVKGASERTIKIKF